MSIVEKAVKLYAWKTNRVALQVVQGEVSSRRFDIQLFDTVEPVNLNNCSVQLFVQKPDSTKSYVSCEIEDSANGLISAVVTEQMASVPGTVDCWIQVVHVKNADLRFDGMSLVVKDCPITEGVESSDEFPLLLSMMRDYQGAIARSEEAIEKAEEIQLRPKFADSVEWLEQNGDPTYPYVLPDGYIYAYWTHTHIEPDELYDIDTVSTDFKYVIETDGSGSTASADNCIVTDFIPVNMSADNPRLIINEEENIALCNDAPARYPRYFHIAYFDESKNLLGVQYVGNDTREGYGEFYSTVKEYGTCTEIALGLNGFGQLLSYYTRVAFVRIELQVVADDSGEIASAEDGLIIDSITDPNTGTKTVTTGWGNTNQYFVPADYEDRILSMENRLKGVETPEYGAPYSSLQERLNCTDANLGAVMLELEQARTPEYGNFGSLQERLNASDATISNLLTKHETDISKVETAINTERNRAVNEERRIEALFTAPTQEAVNQWMNEHPEATTTVQDGSLEMAKLTDNAKLYMVKDYVTPQMYGAKGDGITDDTEALQNCFDDAYEKNIAVYLPSGTYCHTGLIIYSSSFGNIAHMANIRGNGRDDTVLKHTGVGVAVAVYPYGKTSYINGVNIGDFAIEGNDNTTIGLELHSGTRMIIDSISITHVKDYGLRQAENFWLSSITNVYVGGSNVGMSIRGGNITSIHINSCYVHSSQEIAYQINGTYMDIGTLAADYCKGECVYDFSFLLGTISSLGCERASTKTIIQAVGQSQVTINTCCFLLPKFPDDALSIVNVTGSSLSIGTLSIWGVEEQQYEFPIARMYYAKISIETFYGNCKFSDEINVTSETHNHGFFVADGTKLRANSMRAYLGHDRSSYYKQPNLTDLGVAIFTNCTKSPAFTADGTDKGWRTPVKAGDWFIENNPNEYKVAGYVILEDLSGDTAKNAKTASIPLLFKGKTLERPKMYPTGGPFFDTTLKKPIWYNGTNWVDSDGNLEEYLYINNSELPVSLTHSAGGTFAECKLEGNTVVSHEPSIDNPAEFLSSGDYDEETGKYKICVKCTNESGEETTSEILLNTPLMKGETVDESGRRETRVKLITLKIADMNNGESYPGWKNQEWLDETTAAEHGVIFVNWTSNIIKSKSNYDDYVIGINMEQGNVLWIKPSAFGGLTQSEIISQYPDLELNILVPMKKAEIAEEKPQRINILEGECELDFDSTTKPSKFTGKYRYFKEG